MVYFVGAGPGAEDLITVRGQKLIEQADVVIYAGSLVNPELLGSAREDAKVYDSSRMTLEEVISVITDAEAEHMNTVRLHTGEPSIFGAVREQMDELDRRGISYESCPGVTAAFGAASALNMEYTLPGVSQTLIITRMEGRTPVPSSESIESLAAHHASMAVYLSAGMMDELARRLITGGYGPDTPAAIVYKATWPDEKVFECTVAALGDTAREAGITKTAVVLVGDAVSHTSYLRSCLYDPEFTTGYRQGSRDRNE
ncbi:cobalt-precorrin 4 C11-methyltransferase [Lachnospiraceae bacterium XBB2008]|nr:cobalt-precorrin 4 C11-methyltransferase [Lachnospiraceae bacterium XBB2008]